MDHKKSPTRRQKRQKVEDTYWDCSVCTFRNTAEAFKCLMCDVRKGTSTRKPRLNSALVAQQNATLPGASGITPNGTVVPPTTATVPTATVTTNSKSSSSSTSSKMSSSSSSSRHNHKNKHKKYPARLKNVDRSTAQTREVTVNSVTVVITEYKPKPMVNRRESSEQSFSESNDSRIIPLPDKIIHNFSWTQSESLQTSRNSSIKINSGVSTPIQKKIQQPQVLFSI